jgi:transposase-like protein
MTAPGSRRSRRREAAIAALLTASTISEAAHTAGVGERTLRRWLREEAGFAADYAAARRQGVELAIAALQQTTGEAVATLRRNLNASSPAVQVRAAAEILARAREWEELHGLGERLKALDDRADFAERLRPR